jgi:acyl-CoA synthetase (AMP-forming)/AMP-acid ligase II
MDEPVTAEQICDYLRSRLASYKVPQRVVFFDEADFPLTVSGKVHVGLLRGQLLARLIEDDIDDNWKQEIQRSVQ